MRKSDERVWADAWVIVASVSLGVIFVVFLALRFAGIVTGDASYAVLRGCGVLAFPVGLIGQRQMAQKRRRISKR